MLIRTVRPHSRRPLWLVLALLLVLAVLSLPGCKGAGGGKAAPSIYQIPPLSLTDADKEYLLNAAFQLLEGKEPEAPGDHAVLTEQATRGIFLSHAFSQSRAQVSFALGGSVMEALSTAASLLRDKAGPDTPWRQGILKIDLINGSKGEMTLEPNQEVKWERTVTGAIFALDPPLALLPEELAGWGIVSEKGKFQPNNTRQYLEFQRRGKVLADLLKDGKAVNYTTFRTISFASLGGRRVDLYRGKAEPAEFTADTYLQAAIRAGEQLRRFTGPDGKFIYQYDPVLDRDGKSYNELRHCGTTYAMLEVYEITRDEKLLAAARLAIDHILQQLAGPAPKDAAAGWLAIKGRGKGVPEAKLGGAGLCLLMLTKYEAVTGDTKYREQMLGLARFIEFMQRPDGDFASKYYYGHSDETFHSLYYPGEAMLGLVRLFQLTGDRHWIDVAVKGMDYIALVRDKDRTPKDVEHDHWVMIAINELHRVAPRPHYVTHLKKIGEGIRLKQKTASEHPDYVGGFYNTVGSTPAATRNEGMIAGYNLLRFLDDPDAPSWRETIDGIARFQLRCQFSEENVIYLRNPSKPFGGFKESLKKYGMRIDYSQHNISSLLGYYRILADKPLPIPQPPGPAAPAAPAGKAP